MSEGKYLGKFGVNVYKEKLASGSNLFLFERKGMPIALSAVFFSGSRFDKIPGTAHFLEHMLVAGTKKFPTKNLLAEYIGKIGGDYGAKTGVNNLILNVEVPSTEELDIGIEILSECLTNSLFDEKVIEKERGAIISEIRSKKSNPKEYLGEVQRKLYLQGTPAGRSTLGDEESVMKIQKEDLINHYKKFINSGRVVFVASGDVPIGVLKEKIESINLPSGENFILEGDLPVIREKEVDVEFYPGVEHLQVGLTCRLEEENYTEYCALVVLSNILAVGRGSRLVTKLRYENGLVYSVSSSVTSAGDWGAMKINFSCDKKNLEDAKKIILEEFKDLRNNNVAAKELENMKTRISKGSIRVFQTSKSWVDFHVGDALLHPEELCTPEDFIKTVEELELKDIKKVIDKYLIEEKFYTAICGNYLN